MEFNLKRDIDKTLEMIERRKNGKEIEDRSFQQVFAHSTVNHKELYTRINGSFEKFLGLTGSTSPMLNAVCMGAKEVTSFDISVPAGYHNYFKIAAILGLDMKNSFVSIMM